MGPKLAGEPVQLRGSPVCLSTFLPGVKELDGTVTASVRVDRLAKEARLFGTLTQSYKEPARLRIHLPRDTPPGRYEGIVEFGDQRQPVVLDVEASVRLAMHPSLLRLQGQPGEKIRVQLAVANLGNAAAHIRPAHAFGLYEIDGAERAIGRTFASGSKTGQGRADRLVHELAKGHGGLMRVKIDSGGGLLEPGESRGLQASFALPEDLERGRGYSGLWPLHNLRFHVEVTESGETSAKERNHERAD
jgi:hypothetical protein